MLRFLSEAAGARSTAEVALRRLLHAGRGGSSREAESMVYRMSMLRPPPVMPRRGLPRNSCSLIGCLEAPVTPYKGSCEEDPKAYTFISIAPSSASSSSSSNFTVTLQLNGELADVGLKHLKCNDLVYVSGILGSYHKVSANGERYIFYKLCAKELNYVLDHSKKPQTDADSIDVSTRPSANLQMLKESKYLDRLRLWQLFFANPHEWWDNRQSKPYINYPDFKHKDTREKIWLQPNDPPWVRKQLELHDLEIADNGHKSNDLPLKNHNWKAHDFDYSDDDILYSEEA
ncbi:hypothetical protein ACP4OV_020465 [Aristida adscensionis]